MKKKKIKRLYEELRRKWVKQSVENERLKGELEEINKKPLTLGDFKKITKDFDDSLILYTSVRDNHYNDPVISVDKDRNGKYLMLTNFKW